MSRLADKDKSDPETETRKDSEPEQDQPLKLDEGWSVASDKDGASEADEDAPESTPDQDDVASDPDTDADTDDAPENDPIPAKDPAPAPETPPAPPPEKVVERVVERRGGFGAAVLGGVVAAALGFVAGRSDMLDPLLPASLKQADHSGAIADLQAAGGARDTALADLRAAVDAVEIPDISGLEAQIAGLPEQLKPLQDRLDAANDQISELTGAIAPLEIRLSDLEKRPISEGVSEAAIAAYERELASLQDTVAQQRTEVEGLVAEAQKIREDARNSEEAADRAAHAAANRATLAKLQTALAAGQPFAEEAAALTAAGVALPADLANAAESGVPSLLNLQAEFPDAARSALARVRADGAEQGIGAFLQKHLGARSVTPREGAHPDAVLSRAEAALEGGNLDTALAEIDMLPDDAKAALNDWAAKARTRNAALAAADQLAAQLNSN